MSNLQQIEDQIANLTMLDAAELVNRLEKRLGVSAEQVKQTQVVYSEEKQVTTEQTEFSVVITETGPTKINVIKTIREVTSLGLKEAKDVVDILPKVIKEGVSKEEAERIAQKLKAAGAVVEVR